MVVLYSNGPGGFDREDERMLVHIGDSEGGMLQSPDDLQLSASLKGARGRAKRDDEKPGEK
jgi:hypothetical protein